MGWYILFIATLLTPYSRAWVPLASGSNMHTPSFCERCVPTVELSMCSASNDGAGFPQPLEVDGSILTVEQNIAQVALDIKKVEEEIKQVQERIIFVETAFENIGNESWFAEKGKFLSYLKSRNNDHKEEQLNNEKLLLNKQLESLRNKELSLREEKNLLLKKSSPQAPASALNLKRPDFFQGVDQVWEQYLSHNPAIDKAQTNFLKQITEAEVVSYDPVNHKDWNWPQNFTKNIKGQISVIPVHFPAEEEAMGDGITMIHLPVDIQPLKKNVNVRDLFVRNEDVGLIKAWSKPEFPRDRYPRPCSIILGNPGIGKSWHLWKYLVMAANRDLWETVSGETDFPFQPQVIAFVTGSSAGLSPFINVFFLQDKVVHKLKSSDVLETLNELSKDGSVRMLYEPGLSSSPVPHYPQNSHTNIPCTAALSPQFERYKEYVKQFDVKPLFMPCPTWSEIEAILRFTNGFDKSEEDLIALIEKAHKRFIESGPYPRILNLEDTPYRYYRDSSTEQLNTFSHEELQNMLLSIESDNSIKSQQSHRFARYTTPKAREGNFGYAVLVPSYQKVHSRLKTRSNVINIETIREKVYNYQTEAAIASSQSPTILEQLVKDYITSVGDDGVSGLRWEYSYNKLTARGKNETAKAFQLDLHKGKVDPYPNFTAAEMKKDVLYQPSDTKFPFVDLLWLDKHEEPGSISTIQCTISEQHRKPLGTYHLLRKKLNMKEKAKLILYIATIPKYVCGYIKAPRSTFFEKVTDANFKFPDNIEIRVLLPHKEMRNKPCDVGDYYGLAREVGELEEPDN